MNPYKPIVFYAISLYIGCISYVLFKNIALLGAVLAASFLIIIFFTIKKSFSILIIAFFLLGFFSNLFYYSFNSFDKIETIRIKELKDFYAIGQSNGKKIVLKGNLNEILEGDKILAYGKFEKKSDFNKGLVGEFYIDNYKVYKKDMIYNINNLKRNISYKFTKNLGEENAAFIMSICFGETKYLSNVQRDSFNRLGIIHAISVSGFHIAIIYKVVEGILGIIPSIVISFAYMIFTGSQPATIRSFIMILVLKLSKKVYKNYDAISSLSLSALIILTINPYYAVDLGFNLSYLSTLGIILYFDKIKRTLYKLPKSINESLSLTLSAQAFSMPYASLTLGNISFGFIPGNLILLPIYTIVVICGNIALIFINIDLVFNLLCKLIHIIIIILDGAQYILLKISPKVSYMSYIDSIAIFSIIVSFILVKKGNDKLKFVPIIALFITLSQYYNFIPKIQFVSINNINSVIISYKLDRVLIYDQQNFDEESLKSIKEKFYITKTINTYNKNITLKLKKDCYIKIFNSKDNIELEVMSDNLKTVITYNDSQIINNNKDVFKIINYPQNKYYLNGKKIQIYTYNILFNQVYISYNINN